MRILHVTDCYLPRLGGIELHVRDLARAQRAAGHDARIVTSTPLPGGAADEPWVTRLAPAELPALLRRERPDVVHAHVSVISPLAMSSSRRAADLGLPVLVTVHSVWPSSPTLAALGDAVLGLSRRPVIWSAVSNRAAGPLAAVLGPGSRPLVLPNAVDPSFWRVQHERPESTTIVSVMRMVHRKRPLALARMLREVRSRVPADVTLRAAIVGDGPRHGGLARYVDRHLAEWVVLPGRLDRGQIRDLYASASVYVAPATLESFGVAALEARCAGLPVVASSRGGVGDFITPGLDGFLGADDHAMVDAITRLVTDRVLMSAMTAHCRSVIPRLDWDAACAASVDAYAQAAALVPDRGARAALTGSTP